MRFILQGEENLSASQRRKRRRQRQLLRIYENKCFFCEQEIDPEIDHWDIHHINPIANGGPMGTTSNMAPAHRNCHVHFHQRLKRRLAKFFRWKWIFINRLMDRAELGKKEARELFEEEEITKLRTFIYIEFDVGDLENGRKEE